MRRENFKLEKEVDDILEQEYHDVGELALGFSDLINPKHRERIIKELASYGYDFSEVKKNLKNAKRTDWIVLDTECRHQWDPFDESEVVPCKTRKLLPKPKFRVMSDSDCLEHLRKSSPEKLAELQARYPDLKLPFRN